MLVAILKFNKTFKHYARRGVDSFYDRERIQSLKSHKTT